MEAGTSTRGKKGVPTVTPVLVCIIWDMHAREGRGRALVLLVPTHVLWWILWWESFLPGATWLMDGMLYKTWRKKINGRSTKILIFFCLR